MDTRTNSCIDKVEREIVSFIHFKEGYLTRWLDNKLMTMTCVDLLNLKETRVKYRLMNSLIQRGSSCSNHGFHDVANPSMSS